MPIESASYISQLDAANPTGTDAKSTADNHMRLIKSVLKTQFPNFGAVAINTTALALNQLTAAVNADASGNVGVGTSTIPAGRRLVVAGGAIRIDADANLEFGGSTAGLYGSSSGNYVVFFTSTAARGRFDADGNFIRSLTSTTPALNNGELVATLQSDTTLRLTAKGSDGVPRYINLTLA